MAWVASATFLVGQVLRALDMNNIGSSLSAASAVGSYQYVCAIAGTAATETVWQGGWLECNGAAVSRTTYAALFNYLNGLSTPLAFGVGNGTTTFNVPDISGRDAIAMAPTTGNATVKTLGNNDGVTIANRRGTLHRHTAHSHTTAIQNVGTLEGGSANSSMKAGGSTASSSVDGGSGTSTDPLDGGAYLVAGVWVIKALT